MPHCHGFSVNKVILTTSPVCTVPLGWVNSNRHRRRRLILCHVKSFDIGLFVFVFNSFDKTVKVFFKTTEQPIKPSGTAQVMIDNLAFIRTRRESRHSKGSSIYKPAKEF